MRPRRRRHRVEELQHIGAVRAALRAHDGDPVAVLELRQRRVGLAEAQQVLRPHPGAAGPEARCVGHPHHQLRAGILVRQPVLGDETLGADLLAVVAEHGGKAQWPGLDGFGHLSGPSGEVRRPAWPGSSTVGL